MFNTFIPVAKPTPFGVSSEAVAELVDKIRNTPELPSQPGPLTPAGPLPLMPAVPPTQVR